jgi:hypothetical protein
MLTDFTILAATAGFLLTVVLVPTLMLAAANWAGRDGGGYGHDHRGALGGRAS